jgi:hypothetical protein
MSRIQQITRIAIVVMVIICGLSGDLSGRAVTAKTIGPIAKIG